MIQFYSRIFQRKKYKKLLTLAMILLKNLKTPVKVFTAIFQKYLGGLFSKYFM